MIGSGALDVNVAVDSQVASQRNHAGYLGCESDHVESRLSGRLGQGLTQTQQPVSINRFVERSVNNNRLRSFIRSDVDRRSVETRATGLIDRKVGHCRSRVAAGVQCDAGVLQGVCSSRTGVVAKRHQPCVQRRSGRAQPVAVDTVGQRRIARAYDIVRTSGRRGSVNVIGRGPSVVGGDYRIVQRYVVAADINPAAKAVVVGVGIGEILGDGHINRSQLAQIAEYAAAVTGRAVGRYR